MERVGPFALERRLRAAEGQEVWRARRVAGEREPRQVLIRRVSPELDGEARAQGVAALEAEYETLRLLDDPRIPTVFGHFAGQAALARTLAEGPSLAEILDAHREGRIRLDAPTVLDLVDEVAQALRHAHGRTDAQGRPIVHGHLNPRCVRLQLDGSVLVLGFGRALPPTRPGVLAPERLLGGPATPASDQWALAALMIELLTGQALYEADGRVADLGQRLEGRVDELIAPLSRRHPALGRLLTRMLAPRPELRFSDEGELVRALQQVRRSLPGPSHRRSLAEQLAPAVDPPPTAPTMVPEEASVSRAGRPPEMQADPPPSTPGTLDLAVMAASPGAGGEPLPGPLPTPDPPPPGAEEPEETTEPHTEPRLVPLDPEQPAAEDRRAARPGLLLTEKVGIGMILLLGVALLAAWALRA